MVKIPDSDILENTVKYLDFYNTIQNIPFTIEKFFTKSLSKMLEQEKVKYPRQVNIPPPISSMLQGNVVPARTFTIEKPIEGPYGPMWFGDSGQDVRLVTGYKNGDSRFIGDYRIGDTNPHGILAGSTGQGKSVTLNAYIYGMCYMYAPWDLELVLCDPKIVEFKKMATEFPMPQITAVAATSDIDYVISVLDEQKKIMMKRNHLFIELTKSSGHTIAKIADFRKFTGLNMAQILIIVDEFQTLFKNAGKKLNQLISIIDAFARLGRNTGCHLLMASQELGSDLPKGILMNIKLRMAMGCYPAVSEQVLKNDGAAANYGRRGYMILNDNVNQGKSNNVLFRIPFPPDGQMRIIANAAMEKGREFNVMPVLSFYDESKLVYEDEHKEFLKHFHLSPDKIFLGEPTFLMRDIDQCVKIEYTGTALETLAVTSKTIDGLVRYFIILRNNIEMSGGAQNMALCADSVFEASSGIKDFVPKQLYFTDGQYEDNSFFASLKATVYKRLLLLKADSLIFDGVSERQPGTDAKFDEMFTGDESVDTGLNRERFAMCFAITEREKRFRSGLGMDEAVTESAREKTRQDSIKAIILMCRQYGVNDVQLTVAKIPVLYAWIVTLDQIVGLGRVSKSKYVEELSSVMLDAGKANVRIVTFATKYDDLKPVANATRWVLFDNPDSKVVSAMNAADYYPNNVAQSLCVLFDKDHTNDGCLKFKKMARNGELLI